MKPYLLQIMHEVSAWCLAAEEEHSESNVDDRPWNDIEEDTDAVNVGAWRSVSHEGLIAGIVVNNL